jgi:phospholipid-binding lipoprotein MlaA
VHEILKRYGRLPGVLLAVCLLPALGACSTMREASRMGEEPPQRTLTELNAEEDEFIVDEYDPLEGFNRRVYKFNAKFDKYVFLPVAKTYRAVTPDIVEGGVLHFFSNLSEVGTFFNSALQLKGKKAAITAGRFGANSTLGLLGTLDVAKKMHLPRQSEDFGQTLASYGLGPGPYLVIPFLGPSSLRDASGKIVDNLLTRVVVDAAIDELDLSSSDEDALRYGMTGLAAVAVRSRVDFRYYQTGSPFEYELVRFLYLKKREFDTLK